MGNCVRKFFCTKNMSSENDNKGEKREMESEISHPNKKPKITPSESDSESVGHYEVDTATPKNTEELQSFGPNKSKMTTQAEVADCMETDSEDVTDAVSTSRRSLLGQLNEVSPLLRNPPCAPRRPTTVSRRLSSCTMIHSSRMPKHPSFVSFHDRVATFDRWPIQMMQSPNDMAAAGFIYTGIGDGVTCFYCDKFLQRWKTTDEPMYEHRSHSPDCHFVNLACISTPLYW
jgi:hypothetical protein